MMLDQVLKISERMLDMIQSKNCIDHLDQIDALEQQRKTILKQYSDQHSAIELPNEDADLLIQISQLSNSIEKTAKDMKSDLRSQLVGNRKNQKNLMAYG